MDISAIAQNKKSEAVFSGAYFVFLGKDTPGDEDLYGIVLNLILFG
jgi:hypothetical protein